MPLTCLFSARSELSAFVGSGSGAPRRLADATSWHRASTCQNRSGLGVALLRAAFIRNRNHNADLILQSRIVLRAESWSPDEKGSSGRFAAPERISARACRHKVPPPDLACTGVPEPIALSTVPSLALCHRHSIGSSIPVSLSAMRRPFDELAESGCPESSSPLTVDQLPPTRCRARPSRSSTSHLQASLIRLLRCCVRSHCTTSCSISRSTRRRPRSARPTFADRSRLTQTSQEVARPHSGRCVALQLFEPHPQLRLSSSLFALSLSSQAG